jgi:hypothetical protein
VKVFFFEMWLGASRNDQDELAYHSYHVARTVTLEPLSAFVTTVASCLTRIAFVGPLKMVALAAYQTQLK